MHGELMQPGGIRVLERLGLAEVRRSLRGALPQVQFVFTCLCVCFFVWCWWCGGVVMMVMVVVVCVCGGGGGGGGGGSAACHSLPWSLC